MHPVTRALYAALVWALCGVAQAQAQTPAATSLPIFDAHTTTATEIPGRWCPSPR